MNKFNLKIYVFIFLLQVWALIIFSMFSGATVTWIFMKLIHKYMPEYYNGGISNLQFWENFMYYFGIISSQGKHRSMFGLMLI